MPPLQALGGYDEANKCYRTAPAKEYPASMCRAIAKAMFDSVLRSRTNALAAGTPMIEDDCNNLRNMYAAFDPYTPEVAMGRDCMLHN
jgi:hypothetical protein